MRTSPKYQVNRKTLAYLAGVAIGDGNLSNPNGRATRLRISCDTRYPRLIKKICAAIRVLLPANKVSIIKRARSFLDISCYSNRWETRLGWKAGKGSKYRQKVSVPLWIRRNKEFSLLCLKGLIETDGSIYQDRGYKMVNFVTTIPRLAHDVIKMLTCLGFEPHCYAFQGLHKKKYAIRISRNVQIFTKMLKLEKVVS